MPTLNRIYVHIGIDIHRSSQESFNLSVFYVFHIFEIQNKTFSSVNCLQSKELVIASTHFSTDKNDVSPFDSVPSPLK